MMINKILFSLLFLLLLTFYTCTDQDEKNSLVGQWEPVSRPYNLGSVLIFGEDSSFTQIKEARINYTYKLVGDTLISTSFSGLSGEKIIDSAKVTIFQDTLILVRGKIGDQQETIMERYDSVYTKADGIFGFWKWPHQSGREAISEYHTGGKAAISVNIEKREGYYFVNGDSLTVIMPGTSLRDIYFELKSDSLLFPDKYAPFGKTFYRIKDEDDEE